MNIVAIAIIIYLFRKKDTRKSDVAKVSAFPIIALMILSFTVMMDFGTCYTWNNVIHNHKST